MYQPPVPFSEDDLSGWRKAITTARQVREEVATQYDWDGNIDRYRPKSAKQSAGDVNIGADFADVERKKAALFFTTPEIAFVCDEPTAPLAPPQQPVPGQPPPPAPPTLGALTLVHQQVINELLSDSQLAVKGTMGKCLLDILLPAGVAAVRVGYSAALQSIDLPKPDAEGIPEQTATGQILPQSVPVPIHEEFFIARISPKALLLPAEFRDTDIRNASWVGYEFTVPLSQLRAEYQVPDDVEIPTGQSKPFFGADEAKTSDDPPVTGVYLEYRALHFGKSKHPKAVWCLALVDGMDEPLKHGPSPHQTFGPDGRLTPDSVKDYTILPLWIRDLPDSAWVPSDSTITGPLTKEINKFRTQGVIQRDNARRILLYDTEKVTPDTLDKIQKGEINQFVGLKGGELAAGAQTVMAEVATASMTRDSYTAEDYMRADRERIMGVSANQQGAESGGKTTATEAQIVNKNSEARFNQEQARVLAGYLSWVRALDCLVLRYADAQFVSALVGQRKGQLWAQFKAALAGGYRYEVQVDSGKYLDTEAMRRQLIQVYQMTRQDPLINPRPVIEKLLSAWGIDPAEGIAQPQPASPPPPQVGVSLKGDDFNANNPQFEIAIAMAKQGGWQIPDDVLQRARQSAQAQQANTLFAQAMDGLASSPDQKPNTTHGGPAQQQMPISKRMADETGGVNNGPQGVA